MKEVWAPALLADSGAATPSMAPLPNCAEFLEIFFSSEYAAERTQNRAAPGQYAECRTERGAAQNRSHDAFPILLGRHQACDLRYHHGARLFALQIAHDLAQSEHAHGNNDEADPVCEFRQIEGVARHVRIDIGPNEPEQQSERYHPKGVQQRAAGQHDCHD